ncbi:3-dehydroquinate synthase [Kaistia terrae]|uniref:3-dehydroquinate synthase n=1 Tax=Kaistia terrae TaxID=537017 RepID=A0ABW0Q568_9HYPH|nr:3-dehydroquinate synthase [Kaistia terrae]MCX5581247.1 3-dehydroquinate synthase [Kaistia terrae]
MTAEASTTSVRVALGDRAYDILIGRGLLQDAGQAIAKRLPKVRAAVVTDATVGALHLGTLTDSLTAAGIPSVPIEIAPGEASKNFATLEVVTRAILAARLERGDIVIALGGGVVGDLTGFAAAIARRGMRFVQIPTSLLSQVDSSVGGKTGINTAEGKNLVGAFHQPDLVIADTGVLDTLSPREFRAGYAEVAKYGLIDDPAFFAWLEQNWQGILSGGPEREHAVATSCRAKAKVVAADEHETGERALLNLGHTFGHALESATGYSQRLVHGEGVAIGMVLAHQFSARMNLCSPDDGVRVEAHLRSVGLPTRLSDVPGGLPDAEDLMQRIGQDKKVSRGTLTFILTHGVGQAFIAKDVPPAAVQAFLTEKLAD